MKYERLTQWVEDGASLILDNPSTAEEARQQVMVQFKKACTKLAVLEDKIERGELVEVPKGAVVLTPEERAEEMRLCNEERKQAVIEFAVRLKKKADSYNYEKNYIDRSIMYTDIDDLVTEVCGK